MAGQEGLGENRQEGKFSKGISYGPSFISERKTTPDSLKDCLGGSAPLCLGDKLLIFGLGFSRGGSTDSLKSNPLKDRG